MVHDSHSSFCEEVFSYTAHAGTNEVDRTNILAPGFWSGSRRTHLLPAFTVRDCETIGPWEVVSSYSSATAPDSHEISCADPLFQARKELNREIAACAQRFKIYLDLGRRRSATNRRPSATIEPSAARSASCSANARTIASRFSVATIAPARYRK
jgi:hypothetical protein